MNEQAKTSGESPPVESWEKYYCGIRLPSGCRVFRVHVPRMDCLSTRTFKLRVRLDLRNHSPCGFEWGYGGSGPAQLALAMAVDALQSEEAALEVYQQYKWSVVSRLQGDCWILNADEQKAKLLSILKDRAREADPTMLPLK